MSPGLLRLGLVASAAAASWTGITALIYAIRWAWAEAGFFALLTLICAAVAVVCAERLRP